jgi:NAD(P)-dependent dehydrogenase (short-subunit alcohol dehydrogenase family)
MTSEARLKAAIPIMREQRAGHFIQFSSVGGRIGAPGRAAYSAAKWGVEGFSEVLAKEMALVGGNGRAASDRAGRPRGWTSCNAGRS